MSGDTLLTPTPIDGSPAQAFASHRVRANDIARQYAVDHPLTYSGGEATEDNVLQLIAHLHTVSHDPNFHPPGQPEPSKTLAPKMLRQLNKGAGAVGTTVDEDDGTFLGFGYHIDARPGDYDPALKELMVIAYRYRHLLSDDDFDFILNSLVPSGLPGANVASFEKYPLHIRLSIPIITPPSFPKDAPETENHMLLISSSVYLINQLFFDRTSDTIYDNNDPGNGLTNWLLNYMHTIAQHDFMEFNARPYQRYSLHALLNLHEFARDQSIRDAAQILLDYITVKFAVSSNRQRRIPPFRRLKKYTNRPDNQNDLLAAGVEGNDVVVAFFLMYAGPTDANGDPMDRFPAVRASEALIAALAPYRPSPAAYTLALSRDIPAYQHRFYHGKRPQFPASGDQAEGGVEIYYKSPSFLLTAGGMFLNSGYGSDQFTHYAQTAIAQSTTLIPTRADPRFTQVIRFDAYPDERRAVNTAVHQGFACGANMRPTVKKILSESSSRAPALTSHNGSPYLSWKGSGNENLNFAPVVIIDALDLEGMGCMDSVEGLAWKVTVGDTSEQAPALASWKNRLYLAWKGSGNDNLNLMFTHGDGKTFAGKTTFGDTSHHAPALVVHNDIIFLAWTGRGDGNLNVAKVGITPNSTFVLVDKVVLSDTAEEGPALASHNGRLFLAWKGSGNDNLNLIFSDDDGLSFHGKTTFGDTSHYAPALASHDGRLYLAWTGRGDGNLNVASVALFGNTAGGFGIDSLEAKVVLGDTSECAPGLASSNGRLFLAWKGAGNDDLNLLSSRDGSFQSGPWCFGDFGKYGFYVAAYRTPPAHPDQLDTPLENLGLLFAMESHKPDGQETMSFKTFYQSIRDLNAGLPAALEYGGNYSFRAPDGRRYGFWLHPSLDKYQARIVMDGEPNPVQDLTTLPLVEGPYLRSPGGHNGYIEVYYPGCPTPLVLDFRDPLSPVRVDNIGACPQPWVDRAEALLAFADRLSQAGRHAEELAALRDRVAIYRQLAAIDPAQYGPALAAALKDLAQRLLSLVSRQFNANQFAQMSPTAREAIDVYRQAIDAGAETSHIASNLTTLSSWLAQAGLAHESKLAAAVAAELQK